MLVLGEGADSLRDFLRRAHGEPPRAGRIVTGIRTLRVGRPVPRNQPPWSRIGGPSGPITNGASAARKVALRPRRRTARARNRPMALCRDARRRHDRVGVGSTPGKEVASWPWNSPSPDTVGWFIKIDRAPGCSAMMAQVFVGEAQGCPAYELGRSTASRPSSARSWPVSSSWRGSRSGPCTEGLALVPALIGGLAVGIVVAVGDPVLRRPQPRPFAGGPCHPRRGLVPQGRRPRRAMTRRGPRRVIAIKEGT